MPFCYFWLVFTNWPVWTVRATWRLKFDKSCYESGLRSRPATSLTVFFLMTFLSLGSILLSSAGKMWFYMTAEMQKEPLSPGLKDRWHKILSLMNTRKVKCVKVYIWKEAESNQLKTRQIRNKQLLLTLFIPVEKLPLVFLLHHKNSDISVIFQQCPSPHSHGYMQLHLGTSTATESRHTVCTLLKGTAKVGVERVQSVTHPLHTLTLLWEVGGRGFKGGRKKL